MYEEGNYVQEHSKCQKCQQFDFKKIVIVNTILLNPNFCQNIVRAHWDICFLDGVTCLK